MFVRDLSHDFCHIIICSFVLTCRFDAQMAVVKQLAREGVQGRKRFLVDGGVDADIAHPPKPCQAGQVLRAGGREIARV